MPNLPRFSVGDLVRPYNAVRRRKAPIRIGVVVDVARHTWSLKEDSYSYTIHWTASDVVSVGWADHTLEPL